MNAEELAKEVSQGLVDMDLMNAIGESRLALQRLPYEIKPHQQMILTQAEMSKLYSDKSVGLVPDLSPDDQYKIFEWSFYKKIFPYLWQFLSSGVIPQDINFFDCDKRAFMFCCLISYLYHGNGQGKNQGTVTYNGISTLHAWVIITALDSNGVKQLYLVDPYLGAYMDTPITNASNMDINQTHYVSSAVVRFI